MKSMKIKTRILAMNIVITVLSILITYVVFTKINQKYTENEVKRAAEQTVFALKNNLAFVFDNVTQFTNIIYFDDKVQTSLKNVDTKMIDPSIQSSIVKSLSNLIVSGDYISSVWIFDRYFNYYNSYKMGPIKADTDRIRDTEWYSMMLEANGNGFFVKGSQGVLEFNRSASPRYLSYIREIRSKDDYEAMAILMVTIDETMIHEYFKDIRGQGDSDFFIVDSTGEYIIEPLSGPGMYQDYIPLVGEKKQFADLVSHQDAKAVLISQEMGIQDWTLVGVFPMQSMEIMGRYYAGVVLFVVLLNIMLIGISSTLLTRLIFVPMSKLEGHMKLVEQDRFIPVSINGGDNEINNLKRVFNHMIVSIQGLISKVKEEEQIISKNKLDIIQAQINPHFLYNTLDAVSALALIKDNENCFKMTQALGDFYRNNLNSGLDYVTVQDELQCVKSYMTILNIRYGDKIQLEIDVDEEILQYKILKLVLQPIVENAVHHGIKQNGGEGTISISGFRNEDEIVLSVVDDGVGMDESRIQEVLAGESVKEKSGFGIHSLIERLNIYYNIKDPINIISEIGSGTEILISLKILEEHS